MSSQGRQVLDQASDSVQQQKIPSVHSSSRNLNLMDGGLLHKSVPSNMNEDGATLKNSIKKVRKRVNFGGDDNSSQEQLQVSTSDVEQKPVLKNSKPTADIITNSLSGPVSTTNKSGKGKSSIISSIQNRLKQSVDQKIQNIIKPKVADEGFIQIQDLQSKDFEDVQLRKYENKIYDDDYGPAIFKLENKNQVDDMNDMKVQISLQDKLKFNKRQSVNNLQFSLPPIKNNTDNYSNGALSSTHEERKSSLQSQMSKRQKVNFKENSEITLFNSTVSQGGSLIGSQQTQIEEKLTKQAQVQKKLELIKAKLQIGQSSTLGKSISSKDIFASNSGSLFQSIAGQNVKDIATRINTDFQDVQIEVSELSPNKQRRMQFLEHIEEQGVKSQLIQSSVKKNNTLNRYSSMASFNAVQQLPPQTKISANDFASQLETLENKDDMHVQFVQDSFQNSYNTDPNGGKKALPSLSKDRVDTIFNFRQTLLSNNNDIKNSQSKRNTILAQALNLNSFNPIKQKPQMHKVYFLQKSTVLQFDLITDEVRQLKLKKYAEKVKQQAIFVDPNGIMLMTGGINQVNGKVESKAIMIDCNNERLKEIPDMLEPKFKHSIVSSNNKIFVLGGYSDISQTQKSHTVFKYDMDFNKWFICSPMKNGHAGDQFVCLSNSFAQNIYCFGGCDNPDNSKSIERYDSVLDIWITLTYKIHNSLLSKSNQLLFMQNQYQPQNILTFSSMNSDPQFAKQDMIIQVEHSKDSKKIDINAFNINKGQMITLFTLDDTYNSQHSISGVRFQGQNLFILREDHEQHVDRVDLQQVVKSMTKLKFTLKEDIKQKTFESKDAERFLSPLRNSFDNLLGQISTGKNVTPQESFNGETNSLMGGSTALPSINSILRSGSNNSSTFSQFSKNFKSKLKQTLKQDML